MNKKLIKNIVVGVSMASVLLPMAVFAQGLNSSDLGIEYGTSTGLTTTDVRTTISRIINAFMGLLGLVAVVLILLGGFKWMMAQGNEEKIDEAKKLMMSGVVGLIIVLSAYAIAQFVIGAIVKGTGA